jgi:hypothetical protein
MDAAQRERAARSQQHAREFARRYAELATRVNATLAGATHALARGRALCDSPHSVSRRAAPSATSRARIAGGAARLVEVGDGPGHVQQLRAARAGPSRAPLSALPYLLAAVEAGAPGARPRPPLCRLWPASRQAFTCPLPSVL